MREVSLYLHVPFCRRKCDYCHFYVTANREEGQQLYLQALRAEWERVAPLLANDHLVSIYLGGGTPSLLGPDRVREILAWIRASPLHQAGDIEVTLEANPEDISREKVTAFASAGVNRLSIGLQTTETLLLHQLGRQHSGSTALRAVEAAYAGGIHNLSVDLMMDLPNQTMKQWEETLEQVTALPITHLSLYNLTIEPHTRFWRDREQLAKVIPNDEASVEMLQYGIAKLEAAGLLRYEISAFAREGAVARHNIGYWLGRPFLGLGPSAFSYWEGKRFRNIAHLKKWASAVLEGHSAIDYEEKLDSDAARRELLAIALRLLEGVDLPLFEGDRGTLTSQDHEEIAALCTEGLLEKEGQRLRLTKWGTLFYDEVASRLV